MSNKITSTYRPTKFNILFVLFFFIIIILLDTCHSEVEATPTIVKFH